MNASLKLASRPEDIVDSLLAHINSLDEHVMLGFYENGAILVNSAGEPQVGRGAIRAELSNYFRFRLLMKRNARHIFVAGDTASPILDWSISEIGPIGETVE